MAHAAWRAVAVCLILIRDLTVSLIQLCVQSVPSLFRPTDVSHLARVSSIFENKSFCVMSADRVPDKAELERTIVRTDIKRRSLSMQLVLRSVC